MEAVVLTIVLGTQASGSTWLYNVVRALHAADQRPAFSTSADDGMEALDQLPGDATNAVIKSHGMDQRLLKLARLAGARLLISSRDPRDSVVSQRERFGSTLHQATIDLSRAFATICSLPTDLPVLRFVYEEHFTARPETIAEVARFLNFDISDATRDTIFASLAPGMVRAWIKQRLATFPPGINPGHDPVTQWHATHIGDGRVGKWRDQLDPVSQEVVGSFLNTMVSPDLWRSRPLLWAAVLFTYNSSVPSQQTVKITSTGTGDFLAYGPYLRIPRGRWRAVALVRSSAPHGVEVEADIFLPWEDRSVTRCRRHIGEIGQPGIALDFDHHDHFQPLEARLRSVEGSRGAVTFSGWQLQWLGTLD